MADLEAMLDAHVSFEMARWAGPEREQLLRDEFAALYEWLAGVRIGDVVTTDHLSAVLDRFVLDNPVDDETIAVMEQALVALHESALADQAPIGDLIGRPAYDELAATLIGMKEARSRITEQITSSEVYSELIAHVLYQGIKNYLVSENVLTKHVPGASSLMRLGQNALSSASPKLGEGIDRQLTAFVNANITDTIRDSRRYLDRVIDDETLWTIAKELWDSNAQTTVAQAAEVVTADEIASIVRAGAGSWEHARRRVQVQALIRGVAATLLEREQDRSVTEVLTTLGITAEVVAEGGELVAAPWVDRAIRDGYLEARIRSRLAAFYTQYAAKD